jgi:sterol desaturase/sphingolipid hydroxylase (fatty acid hydroxylase superfamily)
MPTPLEILLDPVSLIVIAMYAALIAWEALFPAKKLPNVKFWRLKGMIAFGIFFYLSSYLPLITDPFLETIQFFDLSGLGTLWNTIVAILVYELGIYIWHRAMHSSDFLWKTFHQMHHSAERLDTYGTFYFSIFDMIGFTFLGSICLTLLIGITPQSVTNMILITTFFNIFQHSNIKTPQWLGYIVQRPESHTVHHAKDIHKHNYSDLPLIDILFGTFRNPKTFEYETGFYQGASSKVIEMLTFKDISTSQPKIQNNENTEKKFA